MNVELFQLEYYAQDYNDKTKKQLSFKVIGSKGTLEFEFLDPYMGLVKEKGKEGFLFLKDLSNYKLQYEISIKDYVIAAFPTEEFVK